MLFNVILLSFLVACGASPTAAGDDANTLKPTNPLAKAYWYDGKAEISSYDLQQARYGEVHEGNAVLIFVTEHFSKKSWSKTDNPTADDIPVMKLNFTKEFNTGIYPYSMMSSTFFPFENGKHSAKISASIQEWCGHAYMELKDEKKFEVKVNSYFENESVEKIELDKVQLEDDIWTMIRLNPENLPVGKVNVIPAFFYIRLLHIDFKAYACDLSLKKEAKSSFYTLNYPELERDLTIEYENEFPFKILGWKENYYSGWGEDRKKLTTTGTLKESIRVDYWNKHKKEDGVYRQQLGLE